MVTVRISETYDLSTKVDKMGLIGVHTPGLDTINTLYPGFMTNYRKYRLVGCDITLACASMLPADPLQIGTEAGDIAPQDMFNPILYTAVSNDSFNTILNRVYGLSGIGSGPQSVVATDEAFTGWTGADHFNIYYSLLATDDWKKAMPQSGFSMAGLFPIVHEVVDTYGNMTNMGEGNNNPNSLVRVNSTNAAGDGVTASNYAVAFRGESKRMPAIPTHRTIPAGAVADWANAFPTTFVAAIVTPPAKLHRLFYRMRVSWTIEFFDPIPTTEFSSVAALALAGARTYASDYVEQSEKMDQTTDMVDVKDAEVTKIMTAGK